MELTSGSQAGRLIENVRGESTVSKETLRSTRLAVSSTTSGPRLIVVSRLKLLRFFKRLFRVKSGNWALTVFQVEIQRATSDLGMYRAVSV